MTLRGQIIKSLRAAAGVKDIQLEFSEDVSHGDYSSNVALKASVGAAGIVEKLRSDEGLKKVVSKVEVAGPGFINFWLSDEVLVSNLQDILKTKNKFGRGTLFKGKKIMIEYTDPNPFKEFHIGHLYSNIVGESLARLMESQSATVARANYQGDVGMHVAKAVWGLRKKLSDSDGGLSVLERQDLRARVKFMGEAYVMGATAFKETPGVDEEIKELNKKIFERDPEIVDLYEAGKRWSMEYFELIYSRLGVRFDYYYLESAVGDFGKELVNKHLGRVFEESDGAIVFKGERQGLHTRVFINSEGLPTYEAKELGLAPTKYDDFAYDISLIVTGNEINEYFKVLLSALSQINPELAKKTQHIGHGMVKLPSGKMSSRTGDIIAGEWLLDEAKAKATQLISTESGFSVEEKEDLAEEVAVASVKYALLKSGIGGDITFDFEESIDFQGNSGPYLQYTFARTQSVLRKVDTKKFGELTGLGKAENELLRFLVRFPEIVLTAARRYSPNTVCTYLYDLAQKYNSFYGANRIIGDENEKIRLALTGATGQTLKNGLFLLGIGAPERM